MMKNKLSDLNNHLFAQLERLGDEDLSRDDLEKEMQRSKMITSVAKEIIAGGSLQLKARKALSEHEIETSPSMLLEHK